jgi:hypothetical protein
MDRNERPNSGFDGSSGDTVHATTAPIYPLDSDFYSQMGVAPLPASNLALLKPRLYDEFRIEVPLVPWQDRQFIRISIQGYNSQEDVDALIKAMQVLLPEVAL